MDDMDCDNYYSELPWIDEEKTRILWDYLMLIEQTN